MFPFCAACKKKHGDEQKMGYKSIRKLYSDKKFYLLKKYFNITFFFVTFAPKRIVTHEH